MEQYVLIVFLIIGLIIVAMRFLKAVQIINTMSRLTEVITSLYYAFFKEKIEEDSLDSLIKESFEKYPEGDVITIYCRNGEYEGEIEICREDTARTLLKVYMFAINQTLDYYDQNKEYIDQDLELLSEVEEVINICNIVRIAYWKKQGKM